MNTEPFRIIDTRNLPVRITGPDTPPNHFVFLYPDGSRQTFILTLDGVDLKLHFSSQYKP